MYKTLVMTLACMAFGTAANADPPDEIKTGPIAMHDHDEGAPDTPIVLHVTTASVVLDVCPSDVCVCEEILPPEVADVPSRVLVRRTDHAQSHSRPPEPMLTRACLHVVGTDTIPHRDLQRRPVLL